MYKLIASDLDGTLLLNGSQALTEGCIPLIQKLQSKEVIFVAASGRQYPNLVRLFGDAAGKMAFICENGAFVVFRGQTIQKNILPKASTSALIDDILNRDGCEVLISGEATSYLIPKQASFVDRMENFVKNNVCVVSGVSDIPEPIIKVSAFEEAGILRSSDYFTNRWQKDFKCTVSGFSWIDFVGPKVNKGTALTTLMNHLSIEPAEAAAFGDNYNDIEMLSVVGAGYVMDHAAEDIRSRFSLHTSCVEETLASFLHSSLL